MGQLVNQTQTHWGQRDTYRYMDTEMHTHKGIDAQRPRYTEEETHIHTDIQKSKHIYIQRHKHTEATQT